MRLTTTNEKLLSMNT
jgi:hypothetical protein